MDAPRATSASDLLTAARESAEKHVTEIELWGRVLKIRPAPAQKHAAAMREARNLAIAGLDVAEEVLPVLSWVHICVVEPAIGMRDAEQLWQASPADMSNLASICQMVSQGTPLTHVVLSIVGLQAQRMKEEVARGTVPAEVVRAWNGILKVIFEWVLTGDGSAPDLKRLGRRLADMTDADDFDTAIDAVQSFAQERGVDLGNAPEAESSDSSAPASSGPDEAPQNSPSPDGTGETLTS